MSLKIIFLLLVWVQIKHFLADFPLQNRYMLGKFNEGWSWVVPLLAHSGVHFLFTIALCLIVNPALWWLAFADMGVHFVMDRIKAGKNWLGRWNHTENMYWQVLGIDQMVHHLTDIWIVYMLVSCRV